MSIVDRESRSFTNSSGHSWTEYKLDPVIARRILDLKDGKDGCLVHSWRALSIEVTGTECQMTGSDLERMARWTLDEEET